MGVRVLIVSPRRRFRVPVEAACLSPDRTSELTLEEIERLKAYEGNRLVKLGEIFRLREEGDASSDSVRLVLEGDFGKVWRIGEGMKSGEIVVKGDVGHFLGFRMLGGSIQVYGNAGSWVGAEMRGGVIEVHGNAGDHVGAVLRGERPSKGMCGGTIVVHGDVGAEAGAGMRKGAIIVNGNCGYLPGVNMSGGSILVRGSCRGKAGARMRGGKVVICGHAGEVLPTFYLDDVVESVKVKGEMIEGPFYLFVGDVLGDVGCLGRLYVSVKGNEHLKALAEKLLGSRFG